MSYRKNNAQVHEKTPKPHEIKAVVLAPQQPLQSCVSAKNMSQTKHACVWTCFVLILFQAPALESEWILSHGERLVEEDAQQDGCGLQEGSAVAENPPKSHISLPREAGF